MPNGSWFPLAPTGRTAKIARIGAKTGKALREALHSVTNTGKDELPATLTALDEGEGAAVGGLAVIVTAYVLIDACGNQWPIRSSLERIANTLATKTTGPGNKD